MDARTQPSRQRPAQREHGGGEQQQPGHDGLGTAVRGEQQQQRTQCAAEGSLPRRRATVESAWRAAPKPRGRPQALVKAAGSRPTVLVALAIMGTPASTSAGNEEAKPPPATALRALAARGWPSAAGSGRGWSSAGARRARSIPSRTVPGGSPMVEAAPQSVRSARCRARRVSARSTSCPRAPIDSAARIAGRPNRHGGRRNTRVVSCRRCSRVSFDCSPPRAGRSITTLRRTSSSSSSAGRGDAAGAEACGQRAVAAHPLAMPARAVGASSSTLAGASGANLSGA